MSTAAIGDGFDDGLLIGTVQPDLVRQVRRSDLLITPGRLAMAGGAVIGENLLSLNRVKAWTCRETRQRPHVIRDGDDLIVLEHAVPAESEHGALMRFGVA